MANKNKQIRTIIYDESKKLIQLKKQEVKTEPYDFLTFYSIVLGYIVLTILLFINYFSFGFLLLFSLLIFGAINLSQDDLTHSKEIRITNEAISKLIEDDGRVYFSNIFQFTERNYFELIILPKKNICKVTIEAFSRNLIVFQIPTTNLIGFMDDLQALTGVEIYDSYQTAEKEEVICFRSVAENDEKLPFLNKITENKVRLFINPRTNPQNFIINFQRNMISTYKKNNYDISDIQSIEYELTDKEVIIEANDLNLGNIELIRFKKDKFPDAMIKADMKRLFDYLEEKPALQHIRFI